MSRLTAVALSAILAGVVILISTTVERVRLADYIIRADHFAVDAWTTVSTALIAVGILAGLLAMHAAEIRTALYETRAKN